MKMTIIPIQNLILSLIPVFILLGILIKWKLDWKELLYAIGRMLFQLIMIGYFLSYIFQQDSPLWTTGMLLFMISISAWISLHSIKNEIKKDRKEYLKNSVLSLLFGALPVLLLVVIVIIPTKSWYAPKFIIPLAGMVFASAMNTIGIAAERFKSEIKNSELIEAKRKSLKAALIPQVNSFLAVGLVSLPGMMTGQILSGIDPLIAVRYQIIVMTMLLGAGGISASIFLKRI
jgi:putative ABC transport system permease protein